MESHTQVHAALTTRSSLHFIEAEMQSWGLTLHLYSIDIISADGPTVPQRILLQGQEQTGLEHTSKRQSLQATVSRKHAVQLVMSRRLDLMYKTQGNGDPTFFYYASQRGMKPRQPNPVQQTSKQVSQSFNLTKFVQSMQRI